MPVSSGGHVKSRIREEYGGQCSLRGVLYQLNFNSSFWVAISGFGR